VTDDEYVAEITRLLRTSDDPFWRRLRDVLRARGVNPETAALADSVEDDDRFEFGIVVTADLHAFQYGFAYRDVPIERGLIVEWNELPAGQHGPYAAQIAAASRLLRR
jgi:hypothetical protein